MNFRIFVENSTGGATISNDIPYNNGRSFNNSMPSTAITQSLTKSMFNSPGLSLAIQSNIDGNGDMNRMAENFETKSSGRRSREEEHESRSGSDNLEGVSGDDLETGDDIPPRKKRYHRHTPQQIQELEALFKECPHPDEKQRLELSKRLCLETRQVKFWFQNRRTQMKTQLERHENSMLRYEIDKLRAENMSIREAMRNGVAGEISMEEQHLRIENAHLKDELERVCALASKFLGRPITSISPPLPNSALELGVGNNGFGGLSPVPLGSNYGSGVSSSFPSVIDGSIERSMYLELALAAMEELVKMVETDEPLWMKSLERGREVLNHEEYLRTFSSSCIGLKLDGFVTEVSRDTGMVIINSLALVETLMDSNRWADMFPCLVARSSTTEVISSGLGGTRNGALQLMHAEFQVLTPLVPVRKVNFLRFSKQHAEGVWAVVDVSIDSIKQTSGAPTFSNCRRLPSGCIVQDMPNGFSKVTWIEHAEYEESQIHHFYRSMLSSGMGFGAQRWISILQRQCECLAILMSTNVSSRDHTAITASGRRSMLKLARRMTDNFCAGVCASTVYKWNKLKYGNIDEDVRVMTRKSVDDPGEPSGVVLSAATSVWLPISPQRLFDFLRDERLRSQWDILSNGGPMQEMAHIAKGNDHGNCVSLLRSSTMNPNETSMLILQETCIDPSGSIVVYAPVDIPAMHVVMNGGDSTYVALLPSGFAIVPDGPNRTTTTNGNGGSNGCHNRVSGSGSLLTVAFQILVDSLPTAKLTVESVETVNNLISCTVQNIKAALQSEN